MNAAAPADARPLARGLGAATLGLALAALLAGRRLTARAPARLPPPRRPAAPADPAPQARRLYQAAAMLATSVLSDSALEHYRGDFENPGMFAPLASAAVVLACALRGTRSPVPYATACAVGTDVARSANASAPVKQRRRIIPELLEFGGDSRFRTVMPPA